MADRLTWIVEAAIAESRSRNSWNDRLAHWERPPSNHEEAKIAKAATIATNLVRENPKLTARSVAIQPQGSYFNNTNVRLEADMDLRVQLPTLMVRYEKGVSAAEADGELGFVTLGESLDDVARELRDELAADCCRVFGKDNVTVGKKAVSVDGFDGSHADVDLVPAFQLRYVMRGSGGLFTVDGIGIRSADRSETWNFPSQHHANGIAKRSNTAHRFKRVVRAAKRLSYELCEIGAINRRLPSFLIECLVYLVEDSYFLFEDDDRFGRLLRVLTRLKVLLADDEFAREATEINEIKILFHVGQAWTLTDARNFVDAALARLTA